MLAFLNDIWYHSLCSIWLVGQAVKTPPSHGGNGGSIPPQAANQNRILVNPVFCLQGIIGKADYHVT